MNLERITDNALTLACFTCAIILLWGFDWRIGLGAFLLAGQINRQFSRLAKRFDGKIDEEPPKWEPPK